MPAIANERIGEYLKETLLFIKKSGGSLPSREIFNQLREKLNLSAYERERYEKSGYVRWEAFLHFYSINAKKAGWLRKQGGYWHITPDGEKAADLSPQQIFDLAREAYRRWAATQPVEEAEKGKGAESGEVRYTVTLEQAQAQATADLEEYVRSLNPYELQDLVAALLRAMGFYTAFVAPKGKDGGVDILAYKDPIGSAPPRIKAQVRHREEKCSAQAIRELLGTLRKDGEVGLIVSTSGFTADALTEIQKSPVHVQAVDLPNLLKLWQEYYPKMNEEDRQLLPLKWIAFVDEN